MPGGTGLADTAIEDTMLLGMPQLCLAGLSESWLLKELGHRHWMALARLAGRAEPDFRDIDGAPVYAAFCALSIENADLGALGENDRLTISSAIARVSRTQFLSRHRLFARGRERGTVELLSCFVRRAGSGNHAVARVTIDALPGAVARSGLSERAAAMRTGRLARHRGFSLDGTAAEAGALEIEPCPSQDFNGAGFLYFPSFVAFIDRAEWRFDAARAPRASTLRRELFFYGNVDPGESVRVRWMAARREDGRLAHHCRLERAGDGARLADAFTLRAVP
ncbi:Pnap_2097 family protein [Ancylobacter mangrovi]|uniref:Pnap_2097 family protein n=1 Tax=Ancylobacter mangrovi TaxID=2972472 RepID=UPI002161877C|nr:Pnap_2097 family protein [Ancylobacter mangrovi]MCS0504790.1 hypothetical protein [Ancylobacter mangrovi]